MNVMLLAAGEGTRLRPYTNILPKPAMPFLNLPLAAHALSFLSSIEIDNLVVNTFHLPNLIQQTFKDLPHEAKKLIFSEEVDEILGSGGGLSHASSNFIGGGDFILMNADEIILPKVDRALQDAIDHHKKTNSLATLLVMDHPGVGTDFGGVWVNDSHKVLGFGKSPILGFRKGWHFVGVQILSERVFQYLPKVGASNILYDGLMTGIANGELVEIYPIDCTWFETGNETDFISAHEKCLTFLGNNRASYQKDVLLKTFSKFEKVKSVFERVNNANVFRAETAKIESPNTIEGFAVLGDGSIIQPNCKLKNIIVGQRQTVTTSTAAQNTIYI